MKNEFILTVRDEDLEEIYSNQLNYKLFHLDNLESLLVFVLLLVFTFFSLIALNYSYEYIVLLICFGFGFFTKLYNLLCNT